MYDYLLWRLNKICQGKNLQWNHIKLLQEHPTCLVKGCWLFGVF